MTIACNEHLFFKTAAIYGGIAGGIVLLILVAIVVVFVVLDGSGAVEKNDKPVLNVISKNIINFNKR